MQNTRPASSALSPELHFLLDCCQTEPTDGDVGRINSYMNSERFDPQAVIRLAGSHGILPLVYKALKHQKNVQNATLGAFKSAYMGSAQRNMLMSAELLRIMKLLEENGIEALAFKGPALAQLAYGDITLRQFGDLDILIRREDAARLKRLFTAEGYEDTLNIAPEHETHWYRHAKDMVLYHPGKSILLELHWALLDEDHPVRFAAEPLWPRHGSVTINGQAVPTFCNEDLLVYLCIHGSKHLWERIGWIKDIDLLVRSQSIDWEGVAERTEQGNAARLVLLGLHLSQRHFATPVPAVLEAQAEDRRWLMPLVNFVERDWHHRGGMIANTRAMLRLFPSLGMKLRYLNKVVLTPSKNEYRMLDLPRGLHWAYFLLRPYLLLKKYFRPVG